MMQNASFVRKVIYIVAIVLLLIPLSLISSPSTRDQDNEIQSPGGKLARLRETAKLSQANLGEVEPASETMKLATLGLRPIAVTALWWNANEYKRVENYPKLSATLEQIIKIQPNFIEVWEFQAHNLSYNISREFDDFEDRYTWVKTGMQFLMKGIVYNSRDHRIIDNLGLFFGQKLGRADERMEFRRLFRKDSHFHEEVSDEVQLDDTVRYGGPDNWLVAKQWFQRSRDMVDSLKLPMYGRSPLIFYKNVPSQTRNYAIDIENEFFPDEGAQRAWQQAHEEWVSYGNRPIRTSFGFDIFLDKYIQAGERVLALRQQLDDLYPGVRDKTNARIAESFSENQKKALEVPIDERTTEEHSLAKIARSEFTKVTDEFIIQQGNDPSKERQAYRLVAEIKLAEQRWNTCQKYRSTSNYDYWHARSKSESSDAALKARQSLFEAEGLYKKTMMVEAIEKYEDSFKNFATVLNKYDVLQDDLIETDLADPLQRYQRIVTTYQSWPLDFPLQGIIDRRFRERHDDGLPTSEDLKLRQPAKAVETADEKKPVDEKADEKKPADGKSGDDSKAKPTEPAKDAKKADAKPADAEVKKPADAKPADAKKSDAKPADGDAKKPAKVEASETPKPPVPEPSAKKATDTKK